MSDKKADLLSSTILRDCYSLCPELIEGKILCSTFVPFDEIYPDDFLSGRFEGVEARFPLAEVVNEVIDSHRYPDGTVGPEAKEILLAIRAEIERMVSQIDSVKYAEK